MKKQNQGYEIIRQNDQTLKRSQKQGVNLQKNSTFYFQIGLILCLLMVFGLLEMRFQTEVVAVNPPEIIEDSFDYNLAMNFTVEPEKKLETRSPKKSVQAPIFKEIPDDSGEDDPTKTVLDPAPSISTSTPDFNGLEKKPVDVDVHLAFVQKVPVYPGCEKETTNIGRRECMSDKIQKIVRRNFNSELANDLNLNGMQRISVMFTIDKTGKITKIQARAPHTNLEEEAIRVVELIPEMTPGKMQDKNVGVKYSLPIIFDVQN